MFEKTLKLLESGKKDLAILECREIVRLGKGNPDVLKICGDIAIQCNAYEDAVKWIQAAIRLDNSNAQYHHSLGMAYMKMHRFPEAITSLQRVLYLDSSHADAKLNIGVSHIHSGDYHKAISFFQQALQADPNQAASYFWLGIALKKIGQNQKADNYLKMAVKIKPDFAEGHCQLGMIYLNCGKLVQSRNCFQKAITIDNNNLPALVNLCMVLRDLGQLDEAKRVGHQASMLNPNLFQIWHNLGNVYKDMGQFQEATECYAKAIQINPDSAVTHVGIGIAFYHAGQTEKAVESLKAALTIDPSEGTAICNLYNIALMDCDWKKADSYRRMVHRSTFESLRIGNVPAETPFLNIVRSDDPALNYAVASAWSCDIDSRMSEVRKSLRFIYDNSQSGKIRIGYLSNNFGDHPTAHITRRLYELHDRKHFEVFCYSYGVDDNSRYLKTIKNGCDAFVDIRKMSHSEAAKRINGDGVNILVDLVGFMKGQRISIAALRPAPIQIRWLGMPGTSGSAFFDYLIADRVVTPESQARFYSEKFIYLPDCYQINDNQPPNTNNKKCRADFGLPENRFVYCCFNTSYKLDALIFSAWMDILKQVPNSVIWLMADSNRVKDNIRTAALECGVEAHRIIFAEKIPKDAHLSRLHLADLLLDTHQVNGAASISDALWGGVPVLAIKGNHFCSKMSASILHAMSLDDLVTSNLEDYKNIAIHLAKDKIMLYKMKKKVLRNIKQTTLFDTKRFVSFLELAYERVWSMYNNGTKAKMLDLV